MSKSGLGALRSSRQLLATSVVRSDPRGSFSRSTELAPRRCGVAQANNSGQASTSRLIGSAPRGATRILYERDDFRGVFATRLTLFLDAACDVHAVRCHESDR